MPSSADITVAIHPEAGQPATGAGWLLPDGDVLTCRHVVGSAREVTVRRAGPSDVRARYQVVAALDSRLDEATGLHIDDLALLRPVGGAAGLEPGASCFAGHAELGEQVDGYGFTEHYATGQSGSGRVGQVSAVGRWEILEPHNPKHRMYQGFSGCPVLSRRPTQFVLGLFVLTVASTGRGYLIPIGHISRWLERIGQAKGSLNIGDPLRPKTLELFRKVLGNPPHQPFPLRVRPGAPAKGEPERAYVPGNDLTARDFVDDLRGKRCHALLLADGGSGKSTFFVQVAEEIARAGGTYLWLDAKRLGKRLAGGFFSGPGRDNDAAVNALFDEAWAPASGWDGKLKDAKAEIFVLADGINEIGDAASDLLDRLKLFARRRGNMILIVNARSTTRLDTMEELETYTMAELPLNVVEAVTQTSAAQLGGRLTELLSRPQMLLMWLKVQEVGVPRASDMFGRYFLRGLEKLLGEAKLADPLDADRLLGVIAETTYALLRRQSPALIFPRDRFRDRLGEVLTLRFGPGGCGVPAERLIEKLCEYDVMQASGDELTYHHPLYAEWLAGRHFVLLDPSAWTGGGFGAISIEDSSDDGLKLAVEMVAAERRDDFLTRMYDWRWRRVLEFAVEGVLGLTTELRLAFIGLSALRLCDDFEHSRAAARPYFARLEAAGDAFAKALLGAAGGGAGALLAELRTAFAGEAVPPSLRSWVELLDAGTDVLLAQLVLPAPFLGWSASNLLRVAGVGAGEARTLAAAYDASRSTCLSAVAEEEARVTLRHGDGLRWRIVHTLGRVRPEARDLVIPFLLRVWRDEPEHRDVRFGACRALIEIAFADEGFRGTIMSEFRARLAELRESEAKQIGIADPEFRAMEEFWRAADPAHGAFDAEFVRGWKDCLRDGMSEALRTARARDWPLDDIRCAVAVLRK